MFRDTKEELKRLEQELLAEEDLPKKTKAAAESDGENPSQWTGNETVVIKQEELKKARQTRPARSRRYVGRYEAYNTDKTDENLNVYSEEVRAPKKDRTILFLSILALVLMAAIFGVLIWWVVRFRGLL